jgi:hypothetical protein
VSRGAPRDQRGSWPLRLAAAYREIALTGVTTILVLLCFEAAARVALWLASRDLPNTASLDYYARQEWGLDYWREQHTRDRPGWRRYEPFSLWRSRPFEGRTVHVDAAGIRATPGSACREGAYRILAFGGSTMWGLAAPDWGTIPAFLVRELEARRGPPICVVNLGEGGFVSTQEVIELMKQLQEGVRPHVVIFYDGLNDVVAAAESGRAGVHQGLRQIRDRFEGRLSPLVRLVLESNLAEGLERLRRRLAGKQPYPSHSDVAALGDAVARTYLANYAIVQALGREFGFEAFFFWQPVISLGAKPLTPFEQSCRDGMDPSVERLFREAYRHVQEAVPGRSRLFYIADVFDGIDSEVYAQPYHVNPEGNEAIARRMAELAFGPPTTPVSVSGGPG